jgi:hypothetical protein
MPKPRIRDEKIAAHANTLRSWVRSALCNSLSHQLDQEPTAPIGIETQIQFTLATA